MVPSCPCFSLPEDRGEAGLLWVISFVALLLCLPLAIGPRWDTQFPSPWLSVSPRAHPRKFLRPELDNTGPISAHVFAGEVSLALLSAPCLSVQRGWQWPVVPEHGRLGREWPPALAWLTPLPWEALGTLADPRGSPCWESQHEEKAPSVYPFPPSPALVFSLLATGHLLRPESQEFTEVWEAPFREAIRSPTRAWAQHLDPAEGVLWLITYRTVQVERSASSRSPCSETYVV